MQPYKAHYYKRLREGARRSAEVVVPLIIEWVRPESVVDVGCGLGTWLAVLAEHGVSDLVGVDGDHVDRTMLEIPQERFVPHDLREPLRLDRTFDLVLCLEVAEHLPAECAETFVASLTRLGPVIAFSAAIPGQGGKGHVNEQWPDYWVDRFGGKGYISVDCLRRKVWSRADVEPWYAQNLLLFCTPAFLESSPRLTGEREREAGAPPALVHPRKYLELVAAYKACSSKAWRYGIELATNDIARVVPQGHSFILIDDGKFAYRDDDGRQAIPFLERDGQYRGPPPDDETAIRELDRLRTRGASFIVFAWPAFWWFEHYERFHAHVRSGFPCVLENTRVVAFDLRS